MVGKFIYRKLSFGQLSETLHKSVMSTAVIMFVIANAGVFSFLLNRAGIPDALGVWLAQVFDTKFTFLMGVNAALFLIGMFIETSASIVVWPAAAARGAEIRRGAGAFRHHHGRQPGAGHDHPPFGVNLFAACAVGRWNG